MPSTPPVFSAVWIRARFIDLGKLARGEASFGLDKKIQVLASPRTLIHEASGVIIASHPFSAMPRPSDGYLAVKVPCTDAPEISPTGFTYEVREPTGRRYDITAPTSILVLVAPGDPLDGERVVELADVRPTDGPAPGTIQVIPGAGRGIEAVERVGNYIVFYFSDGTTASVESEADVGPLSYTWSQAMPSSVWIISHPLSFEPAAVEVRDHLGAAHYPAGVAYPSATTVRLTFKRDVRGSARLS